MTQSRADNSATLVAKARALYDAQDMEGAYAAIEGAAARAPSDPTIAFMRAQFAYESWREAVPLFEHAARLNPGNSQLVRNFALALVSEGQGARADALLSGILLHRPDWLDGHNVLASLRATAGQADPNRGFLEALSGATDNLSLRLASFHRLVIAKQWDQAAATLQTIEQTSPEAARLPRLYLECEGGTAPSDMSIFAPFAGLRDPGLALLQLRHALRHGHVEQAQEIAVFQTGTVHAGQFWPYLGLCWRLTGDARADWLEGGPAYAQATDLEISQKRLSQLAAFLRSLHTMNAPYPEQSVRGGTQTDRNILLHHSPIMQALRRDFTAAVQAWRDGLPAGDPEHPLLGRSPAQVRYAGGWSVRLGGEGFHTAHTHPMGWASSAFYVAVAGDPAPDTNLGEQSHAGHLALGMPPPELGLDLAPNRYIQPKPGRLVLFPSTTWHGTVPFSGSERLTVAFDVAPGQQNERIHND